MIKPRSGRAKKQSPRLSGYRRDAELKSEVLESLHEKCRYPPSSHNKVFILTVEIHGHETAGDLLVFHACDRKNRKHGRKICFWCGDERAVKR